MRLLMWLIVVGGVFSLALVAADGAHFAGNVGDEHQRIETLIFSTFDCGTQNAQQCINTVCNYVPTFAVKQRKKTCFLDLDDFRAKLKSRYADQVGIADQMTAFYDELCGNGPLIPSLEKAWQEYNHNPVQQLALRVVGINTNIIKTFKKDMYRLCKKRIVDDSTI